MSRKPFCLRYSAALRRITRPEFCLPIRRDQILERHHPTVRKRNGLVRNRNGRRNVRVIERIIKRVAEEDERMAMMMAMNETHAAEPARKPRTVAIIRIISRSVRRGAVL